MEKDFIDQLTTIPLTQRQYAAIGFEREEIHWRISRYYVSKKPVAHRTTARDPLVRAVSNYDLHDLDFGPLYFDEFPYGTDDYICVGQFDEGIVCVSRYDGTVRIVQNIYCPESIYNTDRLCARSGSLFLDALIAAAIYLEKCYLDPTLLELEHMRESMISYCATLAGHDDTSGFFRVLLEGPPTVCSDKHPYGA
jgi:hypothetical protein